MCETTAILKGNLVRVRAEFRDTGTGQLVDPASATAAVQPDGGAAGAPQTMTRLSLGLFEFLWDTSSAAPGRYWVLVTATGGVQAAQQIGIEVRAPGA